MTYIEPATRTTPPPEPTTPDPTTPDPTTPPVEPVEPSAPVRPSVPGDEPRHRGTDAGQAVDVDVVNKLTGERGDSAAGAVAIVGEDGNLDGSAAPGPKAQAEIKVPARLVAALGFTYVHADGRPMAVDKGATIPSKDLTPGDALRFVKLGYIKS